MVPSPTYIRKSMEMEIVAVGKEYATVLRAANKAQYVFDKLLMDLYGCMHKLIGSVDCEGNVGPSESKILQCAHDTMIKWWI